MELDNNLLEKLKEPLMGTAGMRPSEYFRKLDDLGIYVADDRNIVDDKFLLHFIHAINSGLIENDKRSRRLNDFGVNLGADHYISLCDSAIIKLGSPIVNNEQPQIINTTLNVGGDLSGNVQLGGSNTMEQVAPVQSAQNPIGQALQWIMNNIVAVVIAGVVLAVLLSWLGISGA